MWKPEERGPLGKRSSRWQDNIKMDPKETGKKSTTKNTFTHFCVQICCYFESITCPSDL